MKNIIKYFLLLCVLTQCSSTKQFDATKYVDPNIGAVHARWFFYTPAALPFGMAKLAPHTNAQGSPGSWAPCGYDNRHTSIEGFGHFHEFQIGGVVVMPTTGELKTINGSLDNPDEGYRSRFNKSSEHAEPGYYSVVLKDYAIKAELTATERVGYHRYTFPKSDKSHLIFDIGHKQGESSDVTEAYAKLTEDNVVEGYVVTNPEYVKFCDPGNRVKMYFVAKLSKKPLEVGSFVNSKITENSKTTKGVNNGIYLSFSTEEKEVVEMQVGLSYTSIENAKLNLTTETKSMTFDKVKQRSKQIWNEKLSRIKVEGGEEASRIKFYTGLYHAILGRGLASDVNGAYPKNDGSIGQLPLNKSGQPKYHHYNTDGIWGGFWNLAQVWALAYPEYLCEYVQSNIDFYKENGWLHDGTAAGTYTNGVQTNFQGLLIASAYNCGLRNFDIKKGYEAAYFNEVKYRNRPFGSGKYDLGYFVNKGYIPSKDTTISNGWVFNFGASHALEYCFSSYAVANMAKKLGKTEDYKLLMKQSQYWKNIFDHKTKYIRPKLPDGEFIDNFDPMQAWRGFQEGNAYQYTWYVPHDVEGLMNSVGKELFNERLEKMFNNAQKTLFGGGKEIHSFSGVEKLYNHGNQPCLHNAWLFNYSGKPKLTQKWTRTICNEFYGTGQIHGYGYGQDEDQGQLGAWYVMASMGLFDVQGHASENPKFQIGSPQFDKITINLNKKFYKNDKIEIDVINNSKENIYVKSIELNGKPVDGHSIDRNQLINEGKLTIKMKK